MRVKFIIAALIAVFFCFAFTGYLLFMEKREKKDFVHLLEQSIPQQIENYIETFPGKYNVLPPMGESLKIGENNFVYKALIISPSSSSIVFNIDEIKNDLLNFLFSQDYMLSGPAAVRWRDSFSLKVTKVENIDTHQCENFSFKFDPSHYPEGGAYIIEVYWKI